MRGRKLLSLLLCAALCLSVCGAALAEEAGSDQALKAVTAKVKDTLGLDTALYDDFQGSSNEDVLLGKRWSLEWSGDGIHLSITADSDGKIYSFSRSDSVPDEVEVDRYFGGRLTIPKLPEDKSQAAFAAAQDFLGKVLAKPTETIELENNYRPSLNQGSYRYSGEILLNGLPSPIKCSVSVRASDLTVTRFWRGDEYSGYLGQLPGPDTRVTREAARRQLGSVVKLEARYVLQEDGKTAKVQYVPLSGDDYYVDGATGQLVNLTELRQKLWDTGGAGAADKNLMLAEAAMDAPTSDAGLTQAEKEGAAILADVLSKEELDRAVKNAWPEIGLDAYTLASASYSVCEKELEEGAERTPEDYDVTCSLTYGKQDGELMRNKFVCVDAKTGELKSLYSRRVYQGEEDEKLSYKTNVVNGQTKADAILASFAGDHRSLLALQNTVDAQEGENWEHLYTYQHTAGGYFFPGNAYTIGVDATDGTISRMDGTFDEDVILLIPDRIISSSAAVDAYGAAMELRYGYVEVPESVSLVGGRIEPLLKEAGYNYVLSLKPGFVLTQPEDKRLQGIDAETGEPVYYEYNQEETPQLTYDDLSGHWVQTAAQALAVFDIGLRGGSLRPDDTLTQLDMIALLASVDGYSYDPATATEDETDWLYEHAYSLGLVTPETRDADKTVTRGELVKLILDAAGYERVAALPGIFRCDFADQAEIGADQLGYAALAQGLGLVKGGSDGSYAAHRAATRAEAVAMLYQYMK